MTIIILNTFLFLFIIFSNGIFIIKKILKINKFQGFYEISIYGLIFTIFLSQFLNFFIALNNNLLIINLILTLIFFLFNQRLFINNFKLNFKIFSVLILLILSQIYGSGYSDDLNHYHYSYILNTDKYNFIWGNSFMNNMFGTSPIWLTTHAYFNFDSSRLQDIHILNGIFLLLILGLFLSEFFSKTQNNLYKNPFIFSLILFLLIKFTRLKEFGIDRPAILLFCFFIFYYLKYLVFSSSKDRNLDFLLLLLIAITIVSIKIIYAPIFILLLIIFLSFKKEIFLFDKKFFIVYFAACIFLFKNILGSGCIIFPINFTCVEILSWVNSSGAKELSFLAEYFNKSWTSYEGSLSKIEFVKDFNWFSTWFERGKTEILELFATIFFIIILTLISFKIKFKKKLLTKELNLLANSLILIILFSTLIYFWKNPVIRMNYHVVLSSILLFVLYFCEFKIKKKKIIIVPLIITIFFSFNFSKNINRIFKNNFINDPMSKIKEKIYEQKKSQIDSFTYYVGWFGDAPVSHLELNEKVHTKKLIFNILSKNKE